MMDEPTLVIYRDSIDAFADLAPEFVRDVLPRDDLASIVVQWPNAAQVDEKRRVLEFLIAAAAGSGRRRTMVKGRRGKVVPHEGEAEFLSLIDEIPWWLGDLALVFLAGQGSTMIWFPGSDGSFLHIAATSDFLRFRLVPAIQEIGLVLRWEIVVD